MKFRRDYKNNTILNEYSPFVVRENYKAIRTNIEFSLPDKGGKCIVIGSVNPGEGKTTSCINLAITFAAKGAKVIVIDTDLRRPRVQYVLQGCKRQGVSDVLAGVSELSEVIEESTYENMDFIAGGAIPPNPSELLGSKQMEEMLEQLKLKYDYIFIDTPPFGIVTDAKVVASKSSGVVMVAKYNSTRLKELKEEIKQLQKVDIKLIGMIVNKEKVPKKHYGYYKGYGKY